MNIPAGVNVFELFARQVERCPEAVAVDGPEGAITYNELMGRIRAIAASLAQSSVGPGATVAIFVHPSVDTVAAFLAVLGLGAAYCPLDPHHPARRTEFTLRDTDASVVLTTSPLRQHVPVWFEKPVIILNQLPADAPRNSAWPRPVSPEQTACVLYTSGSTGEPKGALVSHAGIVRLVFGTSDVELSPASRVLLHSPLSFDTSSFEIFAPLLHGGTCVIFPGGRVPTLNELKAAIERYRVDTLFFGPSPATVILDVDPGIFAGLRTLILGGEALPAALARKCLRLCPGTRLVNGYGPTEATTFASTYAVPPDFPDDAVSVPIGRPLGQTQFYVVDAAGEPVEDGVTGELLIGGSGVAAGYLNRPELTAARFPPDAFSGCGRLYRTGDLVRRLPDGNYDYLGRMDDQIKLFGQRVEPGEIAAAMETFPGVSQAVVVARGEGEARQLAGYFTVMPDAAVEASAVRQWLADRLPPYMVPASLTPVLDMPLTRNGKIDRRALPDPAVEPASLPAPRRAEMCRSVPPSDGSKERELSRLWARTLERSAVSLDDGFFDLGGTSLGAMILCSLIEQTTGVAVPVAQLFEHQTPAAMAQALREGLGAPTGLAQTLSTGGGAPLFCVPGLSSYSLIFHPVARHMDRPLIGLNYPGLDGKTRPEETVEALAAALVREVRRIQPDGPYHLSGYSFGGAVAFEMARLLSRTGAQVRSLVLLDAFTPSSFRSRGGASRLLVHVGRLFKGKLPDLARRVRVRAAAAGEVPEGLNRRAMMEVEAHNNRAFASYLPGVYDGDVVLIQSRDVPSHHDFCIIAAAGGWRDHVKGKFRVLDAPGTHLSLLQEPQAVEVARLLREVVTDEGERRARPLAFA